MFLAEFCYENGKGFGSFIYITPECAPLKTKYNSENGVIAVLAWTEKMLSTSGWRHHSKQTNEKASPSRMLEPSDRLNNRHAQYATTFILWRGETTSEDHFEPLINYFINGPH